MRARSVDLPALGKPTRPTWAAASTQDKSYAPHPAVLLGMAGRLMPRGGKTAVSTAARSSRSHLYFLLRRVRSASKRPCSSRTRVPGEPGSAVGAAPACRLFVPPFAPLEAAGGAGSAGRGKLCFEGSATRKTLPVTAVTAVGTAPGDIFFAAERDRAAAPSAAADFKPDFINEYRQTPPPRAPLP